MTQMIGARLWFMLEFSKQLKDLHTKYPGKYKWPISDLPLVVGRMGMSLDNYAYEKDAPAAKATCKALGIKNTYDAISVFINSDKLYELKEE